MGLQPQDFVEELNTPLEIPVAGNVKEAGLLTVEANFPDPDGVLDTVYDFARRLKCGKVTLITEKCETSVFEEYKVRTAPGKCIVSAADTEGIRRGVYHFADILRNYTTDALPEKEETAKPSVRVRINRYRFGSEKHPLTGHDDLLADVDLMPDGYLERLSYEGVNMEILAMSGLYFTLIVPVFCSEDTPEQRELQLKRQEKLRWYVDKAARYGIRVLLYMNTPPCLWENDPALKKHPDMMGPSMSGHFRICPASPKGRRFLYEGMYNLFKAVPKLGGTMQINYGEGAEPCINHLHFGKDALPCMQEKCGLTAGGVMALIGNTLYEGMRDAGSNGELILWNYDPQVNTIPRYRKEWMPDLLRKVYDGVIIQANAESGCGTEQLGKIRYCGDYWLAESNLADCFKEFATDAMKYNREAGAKIQVGTSHELGCIPYLEVPGLLYRKYANLQKYHVTSVFQCWGAGGTPGFMNSAARELSFLDTSKVTEEEFLKRMGKYYWGEKFADRAAKVWKLFSDAFAGYPRANMIQYFGPVADGVTWPLYVRPRFERLYSTWVVHKEISGNSIWECLDSHTLDEVVFLLGEMSRKWDEGLQELRALIKDVGELNQEQDRSRILGEALAIHFKTAYHITRFLQLRRDLYKNPSLEMLAEMRKIAELELEARANMIALQKEWPHLGYNPEARGFKYTESKMRRAIEYIERELKEEFPKVEQAIKDGTLKLEYPCTMSYQIGSGLCKLDQMEWEANWKNDKLCIDVRCYNLRKVFDELFIALDDSCNSYPYLLHVVGEGKVYRIDKRDKVSWEFGHPGNDWTFHIEIPVDCLPGQSKENLRFNISRLYDNANTRCTWPGILPEPVPGRLNLVYYHPADMGFLK